MRLEEAFSVVPEFLPENFDQFTRPLTADFIEEGLLATGTASLRRRRLPAEAVIWLLIGIALMRNESIARVAALLGLARPSTTGGLVAPSALTQARQRLGEAPLEYIFTATGTLWAARSAVAYTWRGLRLYAMDGSTVRVPDSKENWKAFGGQVGAGKRAGSAYPTVRVVALMAVRSHVLAALRFGSYKTGEVTLAKELWQEVPRDEVVAPYHERWEIELGYDEHKTHMLAREEAIRSRTPETVLQQLWAIGLACNLVRVEMERAAEEAGVAPTRIGFVNALSLICHAWFVWSTPPLAPGRIPDALLDLRQKLRLLLLPERRPEGRYPRVGKIKMSNYAKKWVTRPQRAN